MFQHQFQTGNHLLGSMAPGDFDLLDRHLEPVSLQVRDVLVEPDRTIEHVYFLDQGLSSVVVEGEGTKQSEVGMFGREGFSGVPVVLGIGQSPHKTFMQVAGPARRIRVDALRGLLCQSPTLHNHLLGFVDAFMLQVAETAFANARFHLDQRLARWMLMASDRLGTSDVPLTHEFLALMLGVRRPGVTETMHVLEGLKAVRNTRAQVTILDRGKLQLVAGDSYNAVSMASAKGTTTTVCPPSSTIS